MFRLSGFTRPVTVTHAFEPSSSIRMDDTLPLYSESIWKDVSRATFESNIDRLAACKSYVPGERDYTYGNESDLRDDKALPLDLERRLADDFAFISAYDFGVEYVTAATIQLSEDRNGLKLCLAANEGIKQEVEQGISKILTKLELCSTKSDIRFQIACIIILIHNIGLRRSVCEEDIFDIIVCLNSNKIFGRLSCKQFVSPPRHRVEKRKCLNTEVQRFFEAMFRGRHMESPGVRDLLKDLSEFNSCFIGLEHSLKHNWVHEIKSTIGAAYRLSQQGGSFHSRLESLGIAKSELDARVVREIDKLSNYWRISHDLARICTGPRYRQYRFLFTHMQLEIVAPYKPISSINTSTMKRTKRFVHAEVQMILHHEERNAKEWPRVIGSSKAACYLCDAFVKAHGLFHLSKAHRQVYNGWTIPQPSRANSQAAERFRVAVKRVDDEVRRELDLARRHHGLQRFPLQSSINLNNAILSTASISTFLSIPQEDEEIQLCTSRIKLSDQAVSTVDLERGSSLSTLRGIEPAVSWLDGQGGSKTRPRSMISENDHEVTDQNPVMLSLQDKSRDGPELKIVPSPRPCASPVSGASKASPGDISAMARVSKPNEETPHQLQDLRRDTLLREGTSQPNKSLDTHADVGDDGTGKPNIDLTEMVEENAIHVVTSKSPKEIRVGLFDLHIYLEDSSQSGGAYTHGSIEASSFDLERDDEDQALNTVTLEPGEERLLVVCKDGANGRELQFAIRDDRCGVVRLACTWHPLIRQ